MSLSLVPVWDFLLSVRSNFIFDAIIFFIDLSNIELLIELPKRVGNIDLENMFT